VVARDILHADFPAVGFSIEIDYAVPGGNTAALLLAKPLNQFL